MENWGATSCQNHAWLNCSGLRSELRSFWRLKSLPRGVKYTEIVRKGLRESVFVIMLYNIQSYLALLASFMPNVFSPHRLMLYFSFDKKKFLYRNIRTHLRLLLGVTILVLEEKKKFRSLPNFSSKFWIYNLYAFPISITQGDFAEWLKSAYW